MLCKFMGMNICNQPGESSAGNTVTPYPDGTDFCWFTNPLLWTWGPNCCHGLLKIFSYGSTVSQCIACVFCMFLLFYGSIYWNYVFSLGHLRLTMASLGRWKHNSRVPAKRMVGLKDLTVTGWDSASSDINRHQHINNTKLDASTS